MPPYDENDVFGSDSQYLSPSTSTQLKKSSSRHNLNTKRSNTSLQGAMDEDGGNGRFSLAHELAVALMPEPSAGSRLLAEEFGIEYDEGAEGIDEDGVKESESSESIPTFADELGGNAMFNDSGIPEHDEGSSLAAEIDPVFASPAPPRRSKPKRPEQDAMEVLAQDLESTDKFLSHLRHIDSEPSSSISHQPILEKIASDVIRRINDTARDREGQVRELLEYEREFRKIAGEVGGNDVLGQLDELQEMKTVLEEEDEIPHRPVHSRMNSRTTPLDGRLSWNDHDERDINNSDDDSEAPTPVKETFPPPPPLKGPPSPASTVPQLAHLRTLNTSIVATLNTLSEHAQVNGAATSETGRKIRALKNKIGTWRTDWDSAERSRMKIEKWEAGLLDGVDNTETSPSRTPSSYKRLDGRVVVKEHLAAFELALADAGMKTKAIMASG